MRSRLALASLFVLVAAMASFSLPSGVDGAFVIETVDSTTACTGMFASLALTSDGRPCIGYYDGATKNLRYAQKSAIGLWTREVAAGTANDEGLFCSLALDASESPHITYIDTTYVLRYARREAGNWQSAVVLSSIGQFGGDNSLVVDQAGVLHLAQYSTSGFVQLLYGKRTAGAWSFEGVDGPPNSGGSNNSLALDANGAPHISYYSNDYGALKYATRINGIWIAEMVDSLASIAGINSSIVLDAQGNPYISYAALTGPGYDLRCARRVAGDWTIETVDAPSGGGAGRWSSIAIDALGDVHISYFQENQSLRYARQFGGLWQVQVVDGSGQAGFYTSLALDGSGGMHVAYHASPDFPCAWGGRGVLKYAFQGAATHVSAEPDARGVVLTATPNPFSSDGALIRFDLNDAIGSHLAVFDVAGRRIRKLEIESARAYSGQVRWDGRDEEGRDVPPGTYFLRLTSDNGAAVTERVTIVR
jgi:hypothetical protein